MNNDHAVHMAHCNQGEYIESCKYGEFDTCPALNTDKPFDDRWCCLMCRTAGRICDFHKSMEADGYTPPKSFARLM